VPRLDKAEVRRSGIQCLLQNETGFRIKLSFAASVEEKVSPERREGGAITRLTEIILSDYISEHFCTKHTLSDGFEDGRVG